MENASVTSGSAFCQVDNATSTNDTGDHAAFYSLAQFTTGLIIYPILCAVGLTGNALNLIVLSHRKMRTSTNIFLTALAVADIVKLLNDGLYVIVSVLLRTNEVAANRMMGHMYPVSHYISTAAVCVASWLTVSVAVERYISVCHATRAKAVCSVSRARFICLAVFVIMSLVSIPSYLRYTKISCYDSATHMVRYEVTLSAVGRSERFMTGYTWVQNLLRSIIPLFVLVSLNTCIIQAMRKQRVKGKKMSARNRITFMLIIVIIVFILCILPDAIMSTFFGFGYVEAQNLVKGIREITDTLLAINSAVNFIIYCMCSQIFRNMFAAIFCARCVRSESTYHVVSMQHKSCGPDMRAHLNGSATDATAFNQ